MARFHVKRRFDGAFASRDNLVATKQLGVEDVAFAKRRGIEITEMAKSTWVYRKLRNFRAGIEGIISFLKRTFGLDRCTCSGLDSFKSYVYSSVLACNLLIIARHMAPYSNHQPNTPGNKISNGTGCRSVRPCAADL
jgi:hypothetical protein